MLVHTFLFIDTCVSLKKIDYNNLLSKYVSTFDLPGNMEGSYKISKI